MKAAPETSKDPSVCLLYHGPNLRLDGLGPALAAESISRQPVEQLLQSDAAAERPAVVLVDASLVDRISELTGLPRHVVLVAADAEAEKALGEAVSHSIAPMVDVQARLRVLRAAFQLAAAHLGATHARLELTRAHTELRELNRIGLALMLERDPDALLQRILTLARQLTDSDGGALFLVEQGNEGTSQLRFKLVECDSLPDLPSFQEETGPIDSSSFVGHAALTGQPLVIDDVYDLPADAAFALNQEFDHRFGYRRKSMLVVPMVDHRERVVGVLLLVNRKSVHDARITSKEAADRYVLPYTEREVQLGFSMAGQAAISIENTKLHAQIEHLFECFVKAAVTAIDQRDPTTAGHSVRVATLTVDLARAVERLGTGSFCDVRFTPKQIRELRFAAMLHDFGKVGVREEVLVKAKKLPPMLGERVENRFDLIRRTLEVEYQRKRAELAPSRGERHALVSRLQAEYNGQIARLDQFQRAVREANEPTLLPERANGTLVEIAQHTFERPNGKIEPYLAADELHYLQIPIGSLDEHERAEVESHVEETFRFLEQIPWTEGLQDVARFAYGHHEKLNGTGYPRRIMAEDIPLQTRIITIADIFDALTEADRPYKRAVSAEKALDILQAEARAGLVDSDLVRIMIESQVYRRVVEEDWRGF